MYYSVVLNEQCVNLNELINDKVDEYAPTIHLYRAEELMTEILLY